ncbi:Phosphoglucomutase/phosphomannomutase, alpha/beta/alpha domain I family protein [Tritrichomonas foetus]|uniref:Phosphoglucomutase/phosphomannomutase, alpha/beta/alpha domain I family protein n=1 Tax=Tritrichomonas foetus TaxID=1144522 RepID=A0A1J4KPM3_9EUKA|nr:Phosphoglucomutase/phosphomannomutase, alpha/beta/alpha domain I family protein [Tritrichomonas foetus]|eukprot:OHT13257.1 Phosphoglucomutase/phosphomannomutase, alpha/beta/alpha domain I family protein [Tritrichomonas foetus]
MSTLREQALDYLACETNEEYKKTIEALLDNEEGLKKYFGKRPAFGTAGIRGEMGPGYNNLNAGIVLQTAQGYCSYALRTLGEKTLQERGVVLGYDARRGSRLYAEITASVFILKGVKVYLFSTIVPTPYVAYAIRYLNAAGGVMVTASHNPAKDNGYKVYWDNGAQIIEPHDAEIAKSIQAPENRRPWEGYHLSIWATSPLCVDPLSRVRESYNKMIVEKLCFHHDENSQQSGLVITYTAMHGVGHKPTAWSFEAFGLPPFVPVPEQVEGDCNFPTCAFPNPEEGEPVFRMAIEVANAHKSDLIICQDPDADRVGLAVRQKDGSFRILHGNHTGTLLTWWQMEHFKHPHNTGVFSCSTVSTQFQRVMAEAEGFLHNETLTGFKWLGNGALKNEAEGKHALLAFEEAIGFNLIPGEIPDKDAISTAAVVGEMAHYLMRHEKKTLTDKLDEIYAKYGYFLFNNKFFFCHDPEIIKNIFIRMRTGGPDGSYINKIGEFNVSRVRDITNGYDSAQADKKALLPQQGGQMITFYLDNGCSCTIRTSGTEPKIKWYIELGAKDQAKAEHDLAEVLKAVQDDLLQREKYNLKQTE